MKMQQFYKWNGSKIICIAIGIATKIKYEQCVFIIYEKKKKHLYKTSYIKQRGGDDVIFLNLLVDSSSN